MLLLVLICCRRLDMELCIILLMLVYSTLYTLFQLNKLCTHITHEINLLIALVYIDIGLDENTKSVSNDEKVFLLQYLQ